MTPGKSIRKFCVQCVGGEPYQVKTCGGEHYLNGGTKRQSSGKEVCLFWNNRMGRGRPSVKLIRKMCRWCMSDSSQQIAECHATDCALHEFRFGTNPNITEETREKLRQRGKKMFENGGLAWATKNSEAL